MTRSEPSTPGRRLFFGLAVLVAWLAAPALGFADTKISDRDQAAIDEMIAANGHARVIVQYKPEAIQGRARSATRQKQAADLLAEQLRGRHRTAEVRPIGNSTLAFGKLLLPEIERLRADDRVRAIIADAPVPPSLDKSTVQVGLAPAKAGGPRPRAEGAPAVVVLDTGVEFDHPFLAGAIREDYGACYSTGNEDAAGLCPGNAREIAGSQGAGRNCADDIATCGHGTHVAGIIAGWRPPDAKNAPRSGVAPEVDIIPVQIFARVNNPRACGRRSAPCAMAYLSDIFEGLEYAIRLVRNRRLPVVAVNMSLAIGHFAGPCDDDPLAALIGPSIRTLRDLGVAVIVAAGNDGKPGLSFPACLKDVISVGACDADSRFAVRFPRSSLGSNYSPLVRMVAPGVDIVSSIPGKRYGRSSGTSMAAPHVAGLLAKARAVLPDYPIEKLVELIEKNAPSAVDFPASTPVVRRPMAYFPQAEIGRLVASIQVSALRSAAGPADVEAEAVEPDALRGPMPGRLAAAAQIPAPEPPHNHFIIEYGRRPSPEQKEAVRGTLRQFGIDEANTVIVGRNDSKEAISTDKPLDPHIFDTLKDQGQIKDAYRDFLIDPDR